MVSRLEDGQAHAWVEDHGVGIPEEALEPVFERYTRVESDVSRHIQGTGLGLPIVRQIVSMHGGRAWAESTPGQGSVFHVALPLESGIAGRAGRPDGDPRILRG